MNDIIEFDAEGRSLLQAMLTAKVFIDRFTAEYDHYREQALKLVEGRPCDIFHSGTKIAAVSVSVPHRFDVEAFRTDHPGLYAAYVHPGNPVTRLTPTKALQPARPKLAVDDA